MSLIELSQDTTYKNEALNRWISSICPYKILDIDEEEEVIRRYKNGDKGALDLLIKGNQRFLLAAARTYSRKADDILDLIQEGNLGLLAAIEKYDLTYGTKFLSFAVHYIKRQMSDYIAMRKLVKHRVNASIEAYVRDIKADWFNDNGFDMPDWMVNEMVSEEFKRDFKSAGLYFKKVSVVYDDDMLGEDYEGNSVIERITSVENSVIGMFEEEDISIECAELIDKVCQGDLEKNVLIDSLGLFGHLKLTDIEISKKYGLKKWQVGYITRKVMERMRNYVNGKKVKVCKSKLQGDKMVKFN